MKTYTSKNYAFVAINGEIQSISADRKSMSVKTKNFTRENDKTVIKDSVYTLTTVMPFDETYVPGTPISAIAYAGKGGTLSIDKIFTREGGYSEDTLVSSDSTKPEKGFGYLCGNVIFAKINEEKDADGNAKKTADGKTRKRHFDIGIKCTNDKGEEMIHVVKVYDGNLTGDNSPLEKTRNLFEKNEGKSCRAFIITSDLKDPRSISQSQKIYNDKPQVTTYANHIGMVTSDFVFTKVLENEKTAEAPKEAPVAEQPQNYQPTVPEEQPVQANVDENRPPLEEEEDYAISMS